MLAFAKTMSDEGIARANYGRLDEFDGYVLPYVIDGVVYLPLLHPAHWPKIVWENDRQRLERLVDELLKATERGIVLGRQYGNDGSLMRGDVYDVIGLRAFDPYEDVSEMSEGRQRSALMMVMNALLLPMNKVTVFDETTPRGLRVAGM